MHKEFVPSGQSVNQQFYLTVLRRLHNSIRKKCGAAVIGSFTMTVSLPTRLECAAVLGNKNNMRVIPHPPSMRLFPVPSYERPDERETFADVSEVQKKMLEILNNITTEEFQKFLQQWKKHWCKYIESKEKYFEGD